MAAQSPAWIEHGFTYQVVDLIGDIAAYRDQQPSFVDGLRVKRVLEAVERSALSSSTWTEVSRK